jgi:hypothetical protein
MNNTLLNRGNKKYNVVVEYASLPVIVNILYVNISNKGVSWIVSTLC